LPVYIRRNIKLAEAPSYGKTIFEYEQNCHGAEDYRKVAELIHAQFQPPIPPDTSQPVTISEIQDQPSAPSTPSPQPDSQVPPQPSTQPAGIDENQTQPPIQIKSVPQPDSEAQSSEFTQTPTD
jgi:hypothetical protein